jgi:hypothetical protein
MSFRTGVFGHGRLVPSSAANEGFTGRISCATAFSRRYASNHTTSILTILITLSGCQERNFLAIATEDGIYVGLRDNLDRSVRVLRLPNVVHMTALTSHDRFVLIFEKTLLSYSLKLLASVALGQAPSKQLEQTRKCLRPSIRDTLRSSASGRLVIRIIVRISVIHLRLRE